MRIGVPKEIKNEERRVGLTPDSVYELTVRGHKVFVERHAGTGAGFNDEDYAGGGATILSSADSVFEAAELIVKVKEPQAVERARLRHDHTLFTYLHLAADPTQASELLASGVTAIAYESVTDSSGRLPLLTPMSQVAGRMSIQAGAHCLEGPVGGRGVLLGGVPGVAAAPVVVLGGGVVGSNAIQMALGLGADVTVLDRNPAVLEQLAQRFGPSLRTLYSTPAALERALAGADLVIGAVLLRGARAPQLITKQLVKQMKLGAVIVDVAIDQGGCAATSHPTTHADPTFTTKGIVHYCVANMPGAVPRTSTLALNNATLPYILRIADESPESAMRADPGLRAGLNVYRGCITEPAVAESLSLPYTTPEVCLN